MDELHLVVKCLKGKATEPDDVHGDLWISKIKQAAVFASMVY